MKIKWKFLLPLFVFFFQCWNQESMKTQMVVKLLEERKASFFDTKQKECLVNFTREVESLADSLLILKTKNIKYDSLTIPHDTLRPNKPEVLFPDFKKPERESQNQNENNNENEIK